MLLVPFVYIIGGTFHHISVTDGLSSQQVYRICKDVEGFIWVYTAKGIDRYDGNEIRHYRLPQSVESKDNIISQTVMCNDRHGNIWIAQKNGHIYEYDRVKDIFILRIDLRRFSSRNVTLNNIFFDRQNRFFVCLSNGIFYWNFSDNSLVYWALKEQCINCIIQAQNGIYYVGTSRCVYRFSPINNKRRFLIRKMVLPIDVQVQTLLAYQQKLYVGTFSEGVFVVNQADNRTVSLDRLVPHKPIRSFTLQGRNSLLIGIDGAGIIQLNAENDKLLNHFVADEDDNNSLSGNTVSDICVDRYGNTWISTTTNGISLLNTTAFYIDRLGHEPYNVNSLASNHVNVILQDKEGNYWYGTDNGVSLYDSALHKWKHFLNNKNNPAVVLALCEDNNGHVWVGGYGIGTYCIDKQSSVIRKMKERCKYSDKGIASNYIFSIYCDGDNIWFGGINGDFSCYHISSDSYSYYPINCIGDLKPYNKDMILIAGCGGLGFFNKHTGHTVWLNRFGNTTLNYPVRCLLKTLSGEIWLATDGQGLIRYNPFRKKSVTYNTQSGLASNSVNNLIEDNLGRVWFSTEKELYYFDTRKNMIVSVNDFVNMDWGVYSSNAAVKGKNGNLTFGTTKGAFFITPFDHLCSVHKIRLIFSDFKLMYSSIRPNDKSSLLKKSIDYTSKIVLKHEQNSFSISFSAINYDLQCKILYKYQLEHFDNDWKMAKTVGAVNYMNIPSGKYTFRLRAFDKYTNKLLGERDFIIVICPPLWASWWAILLYLIILSVIGRFYIKYRKQKMNEYWINQKMDSFISFAHDIRTPLTLIKAPLGEISTEANLPQECKKAISVASHNVEKLLSMVTRLLDLQRIEARSNYLHASMYQLDDYMKSKVLEYRMTAVQKGISLNLNIELNRLSVCFDKEKMDHILDNLLSNAIKYTHEGSVNVSVKNTHKEWSIEIKDTGIGIPKEEQTNIFHEYFRADNAIRLHSGGTGIGLMITRRLVMQHHGKITFCSEENKGTTFTVIFPLNCKPGILFEEKPDNENGTDLEQKMNSPKNKALLLLAEDDSDMRNYLKYSLSIEYNVICVDDGDKALTMVKEKNPDIIISDIMMPMMNGDELCRTLKSSMDTSHIPIILLTAYGEKENIIRGLEAGANDYIVKPFDLSVLKVRIKNILFNRQQFRDMMLSANAPLNTIDYSGELDKEFLSKSMNIINKELSNPDFAINDFCRLLCMSRSSVYNKIKTLTGQGPNDFIRIVRLNKSKELLSSHKYPISEVSIMVGFSDPKYFSTCFKKQFGISPSRL